ncbi:MAG TPA: SGNH/GDSL hydrolase family protein [Pseudonocardiaceae bacterium]|nr:SGNH/GDSL hydrolase family protein [Pseudonocardiaceae bacterium]
MTFTDAAGVQTTPQIVSNTINSGAWDSVGAITIPYQFVTLSSPPSASNDAAIGAGTIQAQCVLYDDVTGVSVTSQNYATQVFTVTGSSLRYTVPITPVQSGQTIHIASTDPCPGAGVGGNILNNTAAITFSGTTDPATGAWSADVPAVQTAMDGSTTGLPSGTYVARIWCQSAAGSVIYQYADELLTIGSPIIRYAALGDSYSSGEGTFNYLNTQNSCHRSTEGYPLYVANALGLGDPLFVACSGAITNDFYATNHSPANSNEPAQVSHLSTGTQVVTLTIGGNDADFVGVITACTNYPTHDGWGCSKDASLRRQLASRFAALAGRISGDRIDGMPIHALQDVYQYVHAFAPNAKIYVGGYPHLFGSNVQFFTKNKQAPGGAVCLLPPAESISYADARWLNKQADTLNSIIQNQVNAARANGVQITYVPPALFTDHALCDRSESWINGIFLDNSVLPKPLSESFHPTVTGYQGGYGAAFVAVMNQG